MKRTKIKQLIAIAVVSTTILTMAPIGANAINITTIDEVAGVASESTIATETQVTTTTTGQAVSVITTTSQAVKITDFGAKPITEPDGGEYFDSSSAIQKAIDYAAENNISSVDFGEGTYYATGVELKSNITYTSSGKATLKMLPGTTEWKYILGGTKLSNITVDNVNFDGNQKKVYGDGKKGTFLIQFTNSKNITVQNCYLHDTFGTAINFQQECSNILAKNNLVVNTDVGIATSAAASNYVTFEGNEIYGTPDWIWSEPLGIYNDASRGLAHDIVIRNNKIHDKPKALGILVQNVHDILIENNEAYNCCSGITVDEQLGTGKLSYNVTIRNNYSHDNNSNISIVAKDSIVEGNTLTNARGTGVWLTNSSVKDKTTQKRLLSENVIVRNNEISVSNEDKLTGADGIRIGIHGYSPTDCLIENNTINYDKALTYDIELQGGQSNIIRNNKLANTNSNYLIYLQDAINTVCEGDIKNPGEGNISLLDQGKNNIILNAGIKYYGGYQKNRTINYGNPWGVTSDMVLIETEGEYDTIPASWVGRQLTVKMPYVGKSKIVCGGNIKLANDAPFTATAAWGSITFIYDGTNWNEVSRDPNRVDKVSIKTINTKVDDVKATSSTAITEDVIKLLPEKVNVTLSDGTSKDLGVKWLSLCPEYNSEKNGTYVFIGRPILESGISNYTDREIVAHVVVSLNQ